MQLGIEVLAFVHLLSQLGQLGGVLAEQATQQLPPWDTSEELDDAATLASAAAAPGYEWNRARHPSPAGRLPRPPAHPLCFEGGDLRPRTARRQLRRPCRVNLNLGGRATTAAYEHTTQHRSGGRKLRSLPNAAERLAVSRLTFDTVEDLYGGASQGLRSPNDKVLDSTPTFQIRQPHESVACCARRRLADSERTKFTCRRRIDGAARPLCCLLVDCDGGFRERYIW